MPEFIGPVEIPEPVTLGPFPVSIPFGMVTEIVRPVAVHRFEASNGKRIQSFKMGPGWRRFRISNGDWSSSEYEALAAWFESADGAAAQFPMDICLADQTAETIMARFADFSISFAHLVGGGASSSFEVVEVPSTSAAYSITATADRVPSSTLATALAGGAQEMIPLCRVIPKSGSTMYFSDRRVTVGGNLYQPRILDYVPGSQSLGAAGTDEAQVLLGNADGVISAVVDQVNLHKARLEFSFFHVGTGILLNWWAGHIARFPNFGEEDIEAGTYRLFASDSAYELGLQFPTRVVSKRCWKPWNDGVHCPWSTVGTGSFTDCTKTAEACADRGMSRYYGGATVPTQLVRVKDNSTGVRGFGRSAIQSATIGNETMYDQVIPEVFTDVDMPVDVKIAGGRDEGDFYAAVGIVSGGPIGGFSSDLAQHLLDSSPPHDPARRGGWRYTLGTDPAAAEDYFGISQHPWSGPSAFPGAGYIAGVAIAEIRRTDAKGLQLTKIVDRSMQVTVSGGRGGWTWSAPGARAWTPVLTNPVWIGVNLWLEARGIKIDSTRAAEISSAEMEEHFDVAAAVSLAAACDTVVPSLSEDGGTEKQFVFRGIFQDRKPVREWLAEVNNTYLGSFWFRFGKYSPIMRTNAIAAEAFGDGNVVVNGYRFEPGTARFNRLDLVFGDAQFKFASNRAEYYDEDHARFIGVSGQPQYESLQMSSIGISTPSQAGRVATVLTREELGGITEAEWRGKGKHKLRTTVLAANVQPGMVVSYQGRMSRNRLVKFRVEEISLNPDWTMDISGSTVADSMYDLTVGPEPVQSTVDPPDVETSPAPRGLTWSPGLETVPASDLVGTAHRTMRVSVEYPVDESANGVVPPRLVVAGTLPINTPLPGVRPPEIRGHSVVAGGSLQAGQVMYINVACYQSTGEISPRSNTIIALTASDGSKVILSPITYPAGTWAGVRIYAAQDPRELTEWGNVTGTPSTIEVDFPTKRFGRSTPPAASNARIAVAAKEAINLGVSGGSVSAVTSTTITVPLFAGDDWTGRHIAVIGKADNGTIPARLYKINSFNSGTGEATVASSTGVAVDDVVVILATPTATSATSVTDSKFVNASAPSGFAVDSKINQMVRCINIDGRQQVRRIVANTADTLTVEPAFDVTPDGWFIVETQDWEDWSGSGRVPVGRSGQTVQLSIPTQNILDRPLVIGGILVDDEGIETPDEFFPIRMAWIYGSPIVEKSRKVTADTVVERLDKVIIAEAGADTITLPAATEKPGESIRVIRNDPSSAKEVVVPGVGTLTIDEDGGSVEVYADQSGGDWFVVGRSSAAPGSGGGGFAWAPDVVATSGTVTPNHGLYTHFLISVEGNFTLANPSGIRDAVEFVVILQWNSAGNHTVTLGSAYSAWQNNMTTDPNNRFVIRGIGKGSALEITDAYNL